MAKRLIITADDMGYNVERNQGIIECFTRGAITNSSLMVNGVAAADAAQLALLHGLPTGLHLNITEGIPVNVSSKCETLTDEKGHFLGMHGLPAAVRDNAVDLVEVKEEMNAQIRKYEELIGSKPVYVDGHQHCHIIPGLAETFAEVLKEHHIQATRVPHELNLKEASWLEEPFSNILFEFCDNAVNARPIFKAHNIWTSDLFYGLATMGRNMTVERLQAGITTAFDAVSNLNKQPVTCELMTHPGFACIGNGGCGEGPDDFSQTPEREWEKSILESDSMMEFYKKSRITLTSYHQCLKPVS